MQNITISLFGNYSWLSMVCFFVSGMCFGFAIASVLQLRKERPEFEESKEKE